MVRDPALSDPDLGHVAVRRFRWSQRTDADGAVKHIEVSLRPDCTDAALPTLTLKVPPDAWEAWRPLAVLVGPVEGTS